MPSSVPSLRVVRANSRPIRPDGDFVLYWMIAQRRTRHSFALDHACEHAIELGKPLLILEPLRCGHRWASDRIHAFVLAGMRDNEAACRERGIAYVPYVEPAPGAGKGLLEALAARAAVVVTDEYPAFFLPRMVAAAAASVDAAMEAVDGNGLLPLRAARKVFTRAFDFRRFLQREIAPHLGERPSAEPLAALAELPRAVIPKSITDRWPRPDAALLRAEPEALAALPIDHAVAPSPVLTGGAKVGAERLASFVASVLPRYAEGRNQPDEDAQSGLSPYLHFGHVGAHQIFDALVRHHGWTVDDLASRADGKAEGWWGMDANADGFLDELVTWREIGFNMAHHRPDDHDRFESLPPWAKQTIAEHAKDRREHVYALDDLAAARTHDEIWNAAQTQLRVEGRIHNYLRMLWGKKVYEWSPDARTALANLIELNNRYALDGRDPNSYSGIFWCLGRYDRAWGPERPIFGKLRYMTSDSTRRKLHLNEYLRRFAPRRQGALPGM